MEKKPILLINKSGLNEIFKKSLVDEGFEVFSFFDEPFPPFSKNIFLKYSNIFRRVVLRDKNYLQKAEKGHYEKNLVKRSQKILEEAKKYDYCLFFRADLFPEKMLQNLRKISQKMVSYEYDGMEVCQNILNYRTYFDDIFVFDKFDFDKYKNIGFKPLTNCWFPDNEVDKNIKRDFFYVGVGVDERKEKIRNFQDYISKNTNFTLKAILTVPEFRNEENFGNIEFRHKGLSYNENMEFIKTSKAIMDFKLPYHEGLSFRFFEAMNYEKKIITNNFSVKNYDFYNPDNIFICDFEDFSGLENFMAKPYVKIDEKIRQKYGFKNWIKYVLDFGDYQKINLY